MKATKDPTVDNKIKFKKEKKKAKSTVWLKRRKIKKSSENVGSKSLKKTKTQEGKLENVTQCTGGKIWLLLELTFFPFSFLLIWERKKNWWVWVKIFESFLFFFLSLFFSSKFSILPKTLKNKHTLRLHQLSASGFRDTILIDVHVL